MLDEAVDLFQSIGLRVNIAKLKWVATKHCNLGENAYFKVGQVHIPRVELMEILGSIVSCDIAESQAYRHRIGKAWGVFHRWSHVLCF